MEPSDSSSPRDAWQKALIGAGALLGLVVAGWAAAQPKLGAGIIVALLVCLAAGTVVPFGLSLAAAPDRRGRHSRWFRLTTVLVIVGALGVFASFWARVRSPQALIGAGLWLLATTCVGVYGLQRLLRRGLAPVEELAIDYGLLLLPVGAIWLFASRLGQPLLGFHEPIVLLTAAHFHYAGFAAPVLLGGLGRLLVRPGRPAPWDYRLGLLVVCAGVPAVAIGISTIPPVEKSAALFLAVGGLLSAAQLAVRGVHAALSRSKLAALLLFVAGLALIGTMTLSAYFALYGSAGKESLHFAVPLAGMVRMHGAGNAVLVGCGGLVALLLLNPAARLRPHGLGFSSLRARWFVGPDYFARSGALSDARKPSGLVDDLRAYAEPAFEPARVHPAIRDFYEHTADYELAVTARWRRGFGWAGALWRRFARGIGQLELPKESGAQAAAVESRIVDLSDERDGRSGVRGWIRTYRDSGRAIYVAAYACVDSHGRPRMSIAFPLPLGAMTSLLRFEPAEPAGAICLRTESPPGEPLGDEGVHYTTPLGTLRLPLSESIKVWFDEAEKELRAWHEMTLFGLRYLTLEYRIRRKTSAP